MSCLQTNVYNEKSSFTFHPPGPTRYGLLFIYASEEANPLLYYVHVCPHCGFAATEEFSTETDDLIHTHMSEVRLLYLIGELYRRLGKEKQAIIYFSRVIARKKETIEKGIVNMAYDRWQEILEEKKGAQ